MAKAGEVPYQWQEIEGQIRLVLAAQASLIAAFGPEDGGEIAARFLGLEGDLPMAETSAIADLPFKAELHEFYHIVRQAYLYAYQLDGSENTSPLIWHEIPGVLEGMAQADAGGEPSPLSRQADRPLLRVLDTFLARWNLHEEGMDMSMRELSLLANMTVPAVRTALSKAGIRLEKKDEAFSLANSAARAWLAERRSYIPQSRPLAFATAGAIYARDLDFFEKLAQIAEVYPVDGERALQLWLGDVLAHRPVEPDLAHMRDLARIWDLPEALFAGDFVKHLLLRR